MGHQSQDGGGSAAERWWWAGQRGRAGRRGGIDGLERDVEGGWAGLAVVLDMGREEREVVRGESNRGF